MLKLYDYFRSSACYRVRIALNLKSLEYDVIPIHLINNGGEQHTEHYQKINPQELVPTLLDGENVISQSMAIIEYLNDKFPEPPLLPKSPEQKALVRSFALTVVSDIHPLNNLRVLQYLTNHLKISDEEKTNWYHHWIQKGLSALEKTLSKSAIRKTFCFGDQPTLADICLIPQLLNAKRFNCDTSNFPTLMQINENCLSHPAFKQAEPKEQQETVKG